MKKIIVLCCIFSLVSCCAFAQDMLFATIANQQVHDFQRERIRSEYEEEKNSQKSGGRNNIPKSTISQSTNSKDFSFLPETKISAKIKQAIISNTKKRNFRSGVIIDSLLNKTAIFQNYITTLKTQFGLDVQHNYADAFTAYMPGMWRIANSINNDPSTAQVNAVRKQVMANININGWSNERKHESAEYLLYDLIFANEPYEGSRKSMNKKQIQLDSDMVYNRFLEKNDMNLRKTVITESGMSTGK